MTTRPSSRITVCGRVHLGPICVNGAGPRRPTCMACGDEVSQVQRDTVQSMWNVVRELLAPYRRPLA